jgi:hypothetical protein
MLSVNPGETTASGRAAFLARFDREVDPEGLLEPDERRRRAEQADEVGASLKFATAKVERASERGQSDRTEARERQAERSGDFNDQPPF